MASQEYETGRLSSLLERSEKAVQGKEGMDAPGQSLLSYRAQEPKGSQRDGYYFGMVAQTMLGVERNGSFMEEVERQDVSQPPVQNH